MNLSLPLENRRIIEGGVAVLVKDSSCNHLVGRRFGISGSSHGGLV